MPDNKISCSFCGKDVSELTELDEMNTCPHCNVIYFSTLVDDAISAKVDASEYLQIKEENVEIRIIKGYDFITDEVEESKEAKEKGDEVYLIFAREKAA